MTTQEFKKSYRFRSAKLCFNCKNYKEKLRVLRDSKCSYQYVEHYCTANKEMFLVTADTVCDKWCEKST